MGNELFRDAPRDSAVLPSNDTLFIDSSGERMFGRILLPALAEETERCPVILMTHGFPGNEKNYDLAQLFRMVGFAAVCFSYRGVWGSHGFYSLSHLVEDTLAAAACIRGLPRSMRVDTERLYVFGHSMGGFALVNAMAAGLRTKGVFLLSPCDFGEVYLRDRERFQSLNSLSRSGYFHLESEDIFERELHTHAGEWRFLSAAEKLDLSVPYRFIGGTRDESTPPDRHILPLAQALRRKGASVDYLELDDSHDYPASRFRVAEYVVEQIRAMERR